MNDKEFEEMAFKYEDTSGSKKFRNYTREIFESDSFQSIVKKTRKDYKIPKNGFPSDGTFSSSPKQWVYVNDEKMNASFDAIIDKLSKKYEIHHLDGQDIFRDYIFYNRTDYAININGANLCMVSDLKYQREDSFSKKTQDDDDRLYPIAIRISPYASLRDILDFVKKTYKFPIKHLQDQYKDPNVQLGKFKKRSSLIQERNEFIYQNRNLPRKEIATLVAEKFGSGHEIDLGYVGKIISLEKKKRKEL